jgi:hypothetical protein
MADTAKLKQLMRDLRREENTVKDLSDAASAARRRGDSDAEEKATRAMRDQFKRVTAVQAEIEDERQRSGPASE